MWDAKHRCKACRHYYDKHRQGWECDVYETDMEPCDCNAFIPACTQCGGSTFHHEIWQNSVSTCPYCVDGTIYTMDQDLILKWTCPCGHLKTQHFQQHGKCFARDADCDCDEYVQKPHGRRAAIEHTKGKT